VVHGHSTACSRQEKGEPPDSLPVWLCEDKISILKIRFPVAMYSVGYKQSRRPYTNSRPNQQVWCLTCLTICGRGRLDDVDKTKEELKLNFPFA
jgi:hypothetical protein